jgi:mRNA-degrading endonuclease RelE of RelBE toxin-antitoxin system
MSASAEKVYKEFFRKSREAEQRGDLTSAHCTTFRMVQEAVKETIPRDPINRRFSLAGELSNIFRIKKGRLRICWIVSSKLRRVCILYISETLRKEGDVNDPYRVFANLVMSGQFNDIFSKLGVRVPPLRGAAVGKIQ